MFGLKKCLEKGVAVHSSKIKQYINGTVKLIFYKLQKEFNFPNLLPLSLTLSVTYKCNSRCKTCFIWKKKLTNELTLQEWKRILLSIGKSPLWITIGGGEPFLYKNLVPLVKLISKYNHPLIINIPTNALLPQQIVKKTKEILQNCKNLYLIINISLDNIAEKHDEIRGIKGNFKKFKESYINLCRLKKKFNNIFIGINTTISKFNIHDYQTIYHFVQTLDIDSYIAEIADERKELNNIGNQLSPEDSLCLKFIDFLLKKSKKYSNKKLIPRLIQSMRYRYYIYLKKTIIEKQELLPCYAGIASAFIDSTGNVWPCCKMKPESLGNLRKYKYDFPQIWKTNKAIQIRKKIKNAKCYCTLANNFYTNSLLNPIKTLISLK